MDGGQWRPAHTSVSPWLLHLLLSCSSSPPSTIPTLLLFLGLLLFTFVVFCEGSDIKVLSFFIYYNKKTIGYNADVITNWRLSLAA